MKDNLPEHLIGIATFVTAAKSRGLSEAARRLGVSGSAIGKRTAGLEHNLGIKRFHRSTRRLALTADGAAYYTACSAALEEIASAKQMFGRRQVAFSGPLRIDMHISFGRKFLRPVLTAIACENPGLDLTLTLTDQLVDPIEESIDLPVRFGYSHLATRNEWSFTGPEGEVSL